MQAVDLLPAGEALSEDVAGRWVAAALAEAAALQDLDDQLYTSDPDPARLARAKRLHELWRQWATDTEVLLQRVPANDGSARERPDLKRLRVEVAGARAVIEQTPELILERIERARAGDVVTVEEVRRELRTRYRR